jgi:outer membrane biosynthesis protein TonB
LTNVRATGGPQPLCQAAVNALRQWQYKPALLNGKPVESTLDMNMNFSRK